MLCLYVYMVRNGSGSRRGIPLRHAGGLAHASTPEEAAAVLVHLRRLEAAVPGLHAVAPAGSPAAVSKQAAEPEVKRVRLQKDSFKMEEEETLRQEAQEEGVREEDEEREEGNGLQQEDEAETKKKTEEVAVAAGH